MRLTRWLPLLLVAFALASCSRGDPDGPAGWELKPPAAGAKPIAATEKLLGLYPAGSRLKDEKALGRFGPCDNYPFDLGEKGWGAKGNVTLVAFPEEPVAYFKYRGFALRLINRTAEVVAFEASDSFLFIIQEALDGEGRWKPIEYRRQTICGNSFHRVLLKPDQYWQFPAREYTGPFKTKLRFRLDHGDGRTISSNEIEGAISTSQFSKHAEEE